MSDPVFPPIAVVGRACILPGALDPAQLWELVLAGRDVLGRASASGWRISKEHVLGEPGRIDGDRAWSDRGGYVEGFETVFDPTGFAVPAAEIMGLDPLFHWVLHTAREALRDARRGEGDDRRTGSGAAPGRNDRVGAIFGNLSFPSSLMSRFAESVWLAGLGEHSAERAAASSPDPQNRFCSGLPALVLERALGLGGGAFALDAACASSLYAIKLACDRLHDGALDLALAGAVNRADDLFIHVGFSALAALSRSGRSRPFHAAADGLVPAEGAGFVALKRLGDAIAAGDRIHGVIRGIGLSNDGRGQGILVPSEEGQVRALESAYAMSGISPAEISLLECHATGTQVGDATEVASLTAVFGETSRPVPIGSLKSNLGHLVTTAGVAGLIKVLEAMRAEIRPPTLHVDRPLPTLDPDRLRLLTEAEAWPTLDGRPRRAGVSAFGFGGNNAHLIVESFDPGSPRRVGHRVESARPGPAAEDADSREGALAIVGIGVTAGARTGRRAVTEALLSGASALSRTSEGGWAGRAGELELDVATLGIPPRDLEQTAAQQLLVLLAGREAVAEVGELPRERTGVFVGMGTDAEVARYGARWRLAERFDSVREATADWLASARDGIVGELGAAGVVGTMPNIVANRLNRLLDLAGFSASLSAEEHSGLRALEVAARALSVGELDVALVGAVDLCCEPVHEAAAHACLPPHLRVPGDAAVVLVLERLADARRAGHRVYALLEPAGVAAASGAEGMRWSLDGRGESLTPRFGHAHAASGLLHVAAAALSLHHRIRPGGRPWLASGRRRATIEIEATAGAVPSVWQLGEAPGSPPTGEWSGPWISVYEGADRQEVLAALAGDRCSSRPCVDEGCRLVVVATDGPTLERRRERARRHLEEGSPPGVGVHFRAQPVSGELAFVFTSAGAAYHGMGRELLAALPELGDRLATRFGGLADTLDWVYGRPEAEPSTTERLWAASAISQLHAELSRGLLGLEPEAAIGYSSGESNALFAFGLWNDIDVMRRDLDESALFHREIGGSFDAVSRVWGEAATWSAWQLLAPIARVREAIAGEPRVHLAIIHTPGDVVISGDPAGCERVLAALGRPQARQLEYELAVHVPELDAVRELWLAVHRREIAAISAVRIYGAAENRCYEPSSEACAEAILGQARKTLDFPALIEQAWADGVRIFVEHGPQAACSHWIREVLGERRREAVVVALDRPDGGLDAVLDAVGGLLAAGVALDPGPLLERLAAAAPIGPAREPGDRPTAIIRRPAHPDPVRLGAPPPVAQPTAGPRQELAVASTVEPGWVSQPLPDPDVVQIMAPAPPLPPVLEEPTAPGGRLDRGPRDEADAAFTAPATNPDDASTPSRPATSDRLPTQAIRPDPDAEQPLRWQARLERLAHTHQTFVAEQARVHERFLAVREGLQSVARMAPGSGSPQRPPEPNPERPTAAVGSAPATGASPSRPPIAWPPARGRALTTAPERPPAAVARPSEPRAALSPPARGSDLRLDRRQLEIHAAGRISELFGTLFEQQDGYRRQVRMPEPPLLLADRVTAIDAVAGSMGIGSLTTETDVESDSWYLYRGFMPAGIMIESGQADLLLISYLGIDFSNRGERVYRLLGCELTFHGDLPRPGETLTYDIHVDGHARHDDVRLFFFHYDCHVGDELRLSVRGGQAGFFTDEELASSAGILWSPEEAEIVAEPRLDEPPIECSRSSYTAEQVRAFADGRPWACFGPELAETAAHVRSPGIQGGEMLFLERVTELAPRGGPWQRGYLRAETAIREDDWTFAGHFKNDPCMPGTLMFEGCLQALSFFMTGLGCTLERDGWRFQPVVGETIDMRCRGQVVPSSRLLVYEVFVEELVAGPEPTVYADLLCTVDGLKAFHARRVGLRLVPDWPLGERSDLVQPERASGPLARVPALGGGELELGYRSLLACAWGRPSEAFGAIYAPFDGPRRVPRLPGPPYHCMTRIRRVEGDVGVPRAGAVVEAEYDLSSDAWFFAENPSRTTPFCVLLEAALQPCGWLASYVGCALGTDEELGFRNLDGTATLFREITPDLAAERGHTLRTVARLTSLSRSAGMIIVAFEVRSSLVDESGAGDAVLAMDTVFGFFPRAALANQVGLSVSAAERDELEAPSSFHADLGADIQRGVDGGLGLPGPQLLMLDRVTGYWPDGGEQGLGRLRAEKDVDPGDWYFRAHFFQDPVQPGSLGLEAMIQLLQLYMIERGLAEGMANPRFEPLALGRELVWKYRGQVVPANDLVVVTLDVTELGRDDDGPFATASSSLWVDGMRIYEARGLGLRLVSGTAPEPARKRVEVLDPAVDTWLADHRPTWNRPALPMMSIVDRLASAVPGTVVGLRDVQVKRWLDVEGPRTVWTEVEPRGADTFGVTLWSESAEGEVEIASGTVSTGVYPGPPGSLPPLVGDARPLPYRTAELFHGPAFQLMTEWTLGASGASTVLDAGAGSVPHGSLHPALLDAALHGIPHDRLHLWSAEIPDDRVGYPARIPSLELFGPPPVAGPVRCEIRFDGFFAGPTLPAFLVQLEGANGVWARFRLVEACLPKGPLGSAPAAARRAFLRDRQWVEGLRLSRSAHGETRLRPEEVLASDWMPGTIAGIYGTRDPELVAVKEHLAARERIHPGALPEALPLNPPRVVVTREVDEIVVRDEARVEGDDRAPLELAGIRRFWNRLIGAPDDWVGQNLWEGLIQLYVRRVVIEDPSALAALAGRGVLYVANHQVLLESLLVTNLLSGLTGAPVVTMSHSKQEQSWVGRILRHLFSYPGCRDPQAIVYFDPARPESIFSLLDSLKPQLRSGERSFFIHPEGTRDRSARDRVERLSSPFLDLALELDLPIVPVRFLGGLPVEPLAGKLDLPLDHCGQDYLVGRPIEPEELRALPYRDRPRRVVEAMNTLGPPIAEEEPHPANHRFRVAVESWRESSGGSEIGATFLHALGEVDDPGEEAQRLLAAAADGVLTVGHGPRERWLAELAVELFGPRGPVVRDTSGRQGA